MPLFEQAEALFLIVLAGFLGMLIGLDRERVDNPAGLRTHIIICIGAAMFTIISRHAFADNEQARVAAGVVEGIGFIGAGAVLVRRGTVKGLTTAAGIWTTAAIGMAVGTGAWLLATGATVFVWFILAMLRRFSKSDEEEQEIHTDDAKEPVKTP